MAELTAPKSGGGETIETQMADFLGKPIEAPVDAPAPRPRPKAEPAPDTGGTLGVSGAEITRQTQDIASEAEAEKSLEAGATPLPAFLGAPVETELETPGELLGVAARSAARGAITASGVIPATLTGVAMGTPAGLPGQIVGGIAGFGSALFAGHLAASGAEELGLAQDPEKLPAHLRPLGFGAEAFGAGLAGGGGMVGFGKSGMRLPASKVGDVFNRVLDTAAARPFRFLLAEGSAITSAAGAAGVSEALDPGNRTARLTSELAAGFLNPTRLLVGAGNRTALAVRKVVIRLSPEGRKTAAGEALVQFLEAADGGRDPKKLIAILSKLDDEVFSSIPGARPTAGMVTGDVRVAALEAELARTDEAFFRDLGTSAEETIKGITNAMTLLRGVGTPEALTAAAELRVARYQMALDRLMLKSEREATELAEKAVASGDVESRSALSVQVRDIYERSLKRARDIETELWNVVFQGPTESATPQNTLKVYRQLVGELPEGFALPKEITDWVRNMQRHQEVVNAAAAGRDVLPTGEKITKKMLEAAEERLTAKELIRARGEFLAFARGQARTNAANADKVARRFGMMAEALLSDLVRAGAATKPTEHGRRGMRGRFIPETVVGPDQIGAPGSTTVTGATPYDVARSYSFALGETFERSFGGLVAAQGPYGLRVPAEAVLKQAFASGDELATLRVGELREIAAPLPVRQLASPEQLAEIELDAAAMLDLQSRFFSTMVAGMTKDVPAASGRGFTRQLDFAKARKFMKQHGDLLDKFSEARQMLEEATESAAKFDQWSKRVRGLRDDLDHSAAAKVLGVESVPDVVLGALNSARPVEQLTKLLRLAQGSGAQSEQAVQGLGASMWDAIEVLAKRGNPEPRLVLERLVTLMNEPIRPGLPTIRQFMETNGLIDKAQSENIDMLLDAAARVNAAILTRAVGETTVDAPGMLINLMIRATGSVTGLAALRSIQRSLGMGRTEAGPSLLVAQRASQYAQEMVARLPAASVNKLLINALKGEPLTPGGPRWSLLQAITERGLDPAARLQRSYQLHAYAWQAGLLGIEDEFQPTPAQESDERDLGVPFLGQAMP